MMQKSQSNKTVAIYLLIILLLILFFAWFFFYYRHRMYFRFCIERVRDINNILLSSKNEEEKLTLISKKAGDLGRTSVNNTLKSDSSLLGLQKVVTQVTDALAKSIQTNKQSLTNIELAQDELRRQNYENEKFYVSNNVLDNCLSTLKHETMYYPSRIKALVGDGDKNLQLINEMASYYQELYMLLCIQTTRQVQEVGYRCVPANLQQLLSPYAAEPLPQAVVAADEELVTYLFEILRKINNKEKPVVTVSKESSRYMILNVDLPYFKLEGRTCEELFAPDMDNIPFLLCRQIARESGEMANARGCGIVAETTEHGGIKLNITLPKWK